MKLQFGDELVEKNNDLSEVQPLKTENQASTLVQPKTNSQPTIKNQDSQTTPPKIIPVVNNQSSESLDNSTSQTPESKESQNESQFPDETIDIPVIGEAETDVSSQTNESENKTEVEAEPKVNDDKLQGNFEVDNKKSEKAEDDKNSEPEKSNVEGDENQTKTVAKVGVSKFFIIGLVTIVILSALSYSLILTPLGMYVGLIPDSSETTTTVYSYSPEDNTSFQFGVTTTSIPEEPSTEASRDAQRKRNLNEIKTALDAYFLANNSYPTSSGEEKISNGSDTGLKLIPTYADSIPFDPRADNDFSYTYNSEDGASFTLRARLENGEDPAGKKENGLLYYIINNN